MWWRVFLATAVIIDLPTVVHKTFTKWDKSDEKSAESNTSPVCVRSLNFVVTLAGLDLVYTSIERMYSSVCPSNSIACDRCLVLLGCLCACLFSISPFDSEYPHQVQNESWHRFVQFPFDLFICLSTYLLADNRLPLSCTGAAVDNAILPSLVRIGLWVPALLIVAYALLISCGWVCFFRKKDGNSNYSIISWCNYSTFNRLVYNAASLLSFMPLETFIGVLLYIIYIQH